MRDIRVSHLEKTIHDADVGSATKSRMKSIFNLMYKYAMRHEIVDKDYAQLCNTVKKSKPKIIRVPFSDDEISTLWNNLNFPFVDMVLIGIYSGWRPQELAILKIADIDFDNMTYTGGIKTDSGRNRTVPIHPIIADLVKKNYEFAISIKSDYLFNDENGQQGTSLTYDKYRGRFNKIMKRFGFEHRPHDTRHTFITKAKAVDMNEYILKLIVGHAIKDITENTYTHRTINDLHREIQKIKN
jgi:integrase